MLIWGFDSVLHAISYIQKPNYKEVPIYNLSPKELWALMCLGIFLTVLGLGSACIIVGWNQFQSSKNFNCQIIILMNFYKLAHIFLTHILVSIVFMETNTQKQIMEVRSMHVINVTIKLQHSNIWQFTLNQCMMVSSTLVISVANNLHRRVI